MHPAAQQCSPKPAQGAPTAKFYNARHPEKTLLYRIVAADVETWRALASAGQFDGQGDHHTPSTYVTQAFHKYLQCGIFAHGFARARCDDCGHDFFVAFSCKGRGVCPSCNSRRMAETAAHLVDHVFPQLPVRQWVLSVPKRLRYFMQSDSAVLNTVLRIFLRVVQSHLHRHCPSAAQIDAHAVRIGAVAFIHRFGSSLNTHVHFHVCVVDGVFEVAALPNSDSSDPTEPEKITFHAATGLEANTISEVQQEVQQTARQRILRAFVARKLIETTDAKAMANTKHGGGFSVDAGVCIAAQDRAGLERLLRYCARPPFALERLHQRGQNVVYHCPKPQPGGKQQDLILTPLELIARIAALVPPPRSHRHRYFGVLAPNSPQRAFVTAMAQGAVPTSPSTNQDDVPESANTNGNADQEEKPRSRAHYLWAMLIARIYEVFPLLCPHCGGQMQLIAFITSGEEVRKILEHIVEDARAPKISPARGPPLWDGCDAPSDKSVVEPNWDDADQCMPDVDIDQSTSW
ncbi:IS91-like element ISVsa3 family transposase [soil metagenome]